MTNDFPNTDETLNEKLQELIKEANRYLANGDATDRGKRRIALNKLLNAIQGSGKLSKQKQWLGLPNYEDYYQEALQRTFLEICQKTDRYNPEYPVMAWFNKILKMRFYDVWKKDQKRGVTFLPKHQEKLEVLSLDELNKDLPVEHEISEEQQLKEVIENDPENFLINEHIKNQPQANLKSILILILAGKQWQEISQELDVPIATASSFYQRRMHKIINYLKKYI